MRRLNLGCGRNILPGWINLDRTELPGVDIVADLGRCRDHALPFADDTIAEFLMSHVLEHVADTLPLMQELHRIAAPGAILTVRLPYGSSDDAFEDPTHVRAYFEKSFGYFAQPYYWRADYGYRGDWRVEQVHLTLHRDGNQGLDAAGLMRRVRHERNVVAEMIAVLAAVKPIRPPRAELQNAPTITLSLA